jgi:hypothetical protein
MKVQQAYCMKEKQKRDMVNPKKSKAKNGRNMLKGECKSCGTKMSKFVK